MTDRQNKKKNLYAAILFVVVLAATVTVIQLVGFGFDLLKIKFNITNQATSITTPSFTSTADVSPFEEKNTMNSRVIIDTFSNSAPNNVPNGKINIALTVKGRIAKGYLYVIADAGGKALGNIDPGKFDDVYMNLIQLTLDNKNPDKYEFGGHLVASASLDTHQDSKHTELLFPLNNVVYIKSYTDSNGMLVDPKKSLSSNWLEVLNDNAHSTKIEAFSSTLKKGTIEKAIIYYTCETNSDCSVTSSRI